MGPSAGYLNQGGSATAVGPVAGNNGQGESAIAVGRDAGKTSQGAQSVAVGYGAGQHNQGPYSTAMGLAAGQTSQGQQSVAVGYATGQQGQGNYTVAMGNSAGQTSQGIYGTAMGHYAAQYNQAYGGVAVGADTARYIQSSYATAVGIAAAYSNQANYATAVGNAAGAYNQGGNAVAMGRDAGRLSQGASSVAVGQQAGYQNQGYLSVAVGCVSGYTNQGNYAVAVGDQAGYSNQDGHAIAIGRFSGSNNQGASCVAIGLRAGEIGQGDDCVALGNQAGRYNQPNSSFYVSTLCVRNQGGTYYMRYDIGTGEVSYSSSDDRVKDDETVITGAVKTLSKLRPQNYLKRTKLDPYAPEQNWSLESGLMAQEIYYSAPELRHIVGVPPEAGDVEKYTPPPSDDPTQDPDYSVWGDGIATVDYMQMVPYLVKGVQEIVSELPRSKTTVSNAWGQNIAGLVVSATTNTHKTNVTPLVTLSNVYADKKWYGVVSEQTADTNDYDTLVDTKGDTQIWVTDVGGPLESGDLVTTSNVAPGYTQKQGDDLLRSSTVAKVTQDCDFTEPTQRPIRVPKKELSNVTYYLRVTEQDINLDAYEKLYETQRKIKTTPVYVKEVGENEMGEEQFFHGEIQVSKEKYETLPEDERSKKRVVELETDKYDELTDEEKAEYTLGTRERWFIVTTTKSKNPIPEHDEEVVIEELVDVLDENGQIVWEETGETEPVYTLVDHGSYKAALVSAKLV